MSTQRKELSFEGQNIYIGIDVHLKSCSMTLMSERLHQTAANWLEVCGQESSKGNVPESESLEIRSLIRLRDSITKDQMRQKYRIKSHLRYLGIEIPVEYMRPGACWNKRFVLWLKSVEANTIQCTPLSVRVK